jgi:hypothetical protein
MSNEYVKRCPAVVLLCLGMVAAAGAQDRFFAGTLAGISTLSGDARSLATTNSTAVSLYRPSNGPVLDLFAGKHLYEYFSVQGNYLWNRNDVVLVSSISSPAGSAFYEQKRGTTQQAVIADALLYFRDRRSWARPYLSAGTGFVHLSSKQDQLVATSGSPVLPPTRFSATGPVLRVAVGIDLRFHKDWSFRYSFSENLGNNPISDHLSPPGKGSLKNFKNLFGFVKTF